MGLFARFCFGQDFDSIIRSPYIEIKDFLIVKNLLGKDEKVIALFLGKSNSYEDLEIVVTTDRFMVLDRSSTKGGTGEPLTRYTCKLSDLKKQLEIKNRGALYCDLEIHAHLLQLGGGAALEMQICWLSAPEKAGFVVPIR